MTQHKLEKGTTIGGRFEIIEPAGIGDFGEMYKAKDTKAGRPIALRIIPADQVTGDEMVAALREQVKSASKLIHRNIRAVFGMGQEEDGSVYIAAEWIDGLNLRSLLEKRIKEGKRFSFKGAYNLMGHICNAMNHAGDKHKHGTLSPRAILVTKSGRVKVSDFELASFRRDIKSYPDNKRSETAFWSPEVLAGKDFASVKADVFSLGAIYYELITGNFPQRPLTAPSTLGFPKEADQVLAKCMNADPAGRYNAVTDLKKDLSKLVEIHESANVQAQVDDDIGIDVEIDLSGMHEQPPVPGGGMLNAPDLPAPPTGAQSASNAASSFDMSEILGRISKTEAAHWMVQKDKFDHGPFSDRELVQMIVNGDVLGKHMLLDMDTGVRKKMRNWPQFEEFIELYREKKKERDEAEALVKSDKAEKRSAMFFVVLVVSVLGVVGLSVTAFLMTRQMRKEKTYDKEGILAALDSGEIEIKTGSQKVSGGKKRRGKRGKSGKGGSREFVPGMSYEEAMNMGVDLGSLKSGGGQKQLTPAQISSIMDRNVRKFLPCVAGSGVKRVDMNIAIGGNGKVIGVSVSQGDGKLKKCVKSVVRRIKFPESAAPRTATSWYFELI